MAARGLKRANEGEGFFNCVGESVGESVDDAPLRAAARGRLVT